MHPIMHMKVNGLYCIAWIPDIEMTSILGPPSVAVKREEGLDDGAARKGWDVGGATWSDSVSG